MWCRTILTAVAISYVICMLLWSGLQKEDLDSSTLEKLGRYNVNIDDMNNQQLREECLVPHVTTEVQRELKTSTANENNENGFTVGIYPKMGMLLAANFKDIIVVQHEDKLNKTNNVDKMPIIGQRMPDLGNATQALGNKGSSIKIEYNNQNQPNVESVMNFWTKLTGYSTAVVTILPTTAVAPVTTAAQTPKAKSITAKENYNNGYVHSREIEYINRILAEYLASQTVPTTTQKVSTKKVFANHFPKKYWEVSRKGSIEEEPKRRIEQKEINTINNVTEDDLHEIQDTLKRQIEKNEPKVRQSKSDKTNKTIGILQRLLQMRNDLFNNGIITSETESNTETVKSFPDKSKELQEASVSFNLFKLFQNMEAYQNNFKNVQSPSSHLKDETWEPIPLSNHNINKELKTSPKVTKEKNQEQKFVMYDIFKTTPSKTIIPERTKLYHDDNRVEDRKKSRLHQNSDVQHKESRFQAMLPSIKYSQPNTNSEITNSQAEAMSGEMNEPQENKNVHLLSGKKAIIFQQPAINADSGDIEQIIIGLNRNQFKKTKKIKTIQEIINNFDLDNKQLTNKQLNKNVSDTKATKNVDSMNMSDVQAIPSNIIRQIAENVKRMVLKDIGVDVNTTTVRTTSTTVGTTSTTVGTTSTTVRTTKTTVAPSTISSTSVPTTISTSESPSTSLQKTFIQTNQVMQELMKIFKELKAAKDTVKLANQHPQNTTTVSDGGKNFRQLPIQPYPETSASKNPYLMKNPPLFKPIQANSEPKIVQVSISSAGNPSQYMAPKLMPPLNVQPKKDYRFGAITIQTNSFEIAPLAIEIPPLKSMNQHIVVTTKRTVEQQKRERDSIKYVDDKFRIPTDLAHLRKKPHSDLPKPVHFAEKHAFRDRYFGGRYLDREKPWYNHEYHEKIHNMENTHPVKSRFPELHYPGRLTHLENLGRPKHLSYSEDLNHPKGYNRPESNEPVYQQNGMARGYHPGSYGNSDYDRQPRYEATKFHEKLERFDDRPRSGWKDFHSRSDSSNDEISARQQLPLLKVKQRPRYDDTHFKNFLKTQQKVTDMLEKLLADNAKVSDLHSVQTP